MFTRLTIILIISIFTLNIAHAWRPGDDVHHLDVKYLPERKDFTFGLDDKMKSEIEKGKHPIKVVIFFLTRAANINSVVSQIEQLQNNYPNIDIALITPDPKVDAENFAKNNPQITLPIGFDNKRITTGKYMDNSILYPMAFVANENEKIIWNGELTDLNEMIEKYNAGEFDEKIARKISPLLDELPILLRSPNERDLKVAVDKILNLSAGNAPALRFRIFQLENLGKVNEAVLLLEKQIKKEPKLTRLYLSLLDLKARYRNLDVNPEKIVEEYMLNIKNSPQSDNIVVWIILNSFPENTLLFKSALKLIARIEKLNPSKQLQASTKNNKAQVFYKLCLLNEALNEQILATKLWQNLNINSAVIESQEKEQFFKNIIKLQNNVKKGIQNQ